jgi:hypothetical protein
MGDNLGRQDRTLVERVRRYRRPEAARATIMAEIEAAYRRGRGDSGKLDLQPIVAKASPRLESAVGCRLIGIRPTRAGSSATLPGVSLGVAPAGGVGHDPTGQRPGRTLRESPSPPLFPAVEARGGCGVAAIVPSTRSRSRMIARPASLRARPARSR